MHKCDFTDEFVEVFRSDAGRKLTNSFRHENTCVIQTIAKAATERGLDEKGCETCTDHT